MRLVAASFAWPFRGEWRARWAVGVLVVLLLPIAFIPLLGYAIAATRAAVHNPETGPPPWAASRRLLADGFWTALVLALLAAPFAIALSPLANALVGAHLWNVSDRALSNVYGYVGAVLLLALPWGLLLLLVMPHATRRFAITGRPRDLFDLGASIRGVRRDFPTWNVAAAAIVTAWALGAACIGLLCVGVLLGIFYAILVSAHASAALEDSTATRAVESANPPSG